MKAKLATFGVSSLSISLRVIYGLLVYPYQTVLELVKHRVFLPIVLVPLTTFAIIKLIWFLVIQPLLSIKHSLLLNFLANWVVIFLGLWQLLLVYLTIRFYIASRS